MSLFFSVIDYNATETTTYDRFEIIPYVPEDEFILTRQDKIVNAVSKLFKDRKLNVIYIRDLCNLEEETRDSVVIYYAILEDTLKDIIDLYTGQNSSIILCDTILEEPKYINNLVDRFRHIGFSTLDDLVSLDFPVENMLIYNNDLTGIRLNELCNNIWS